MVKSINNAFDHMELCLALQAVKQNLSNSLVKICFFFPESNFAIDFPGSSFLLPTFSTGGKYDFQVANLLLATVNFEPCSC